MKNKKSTNSLYLAFKDYNDPELFLGLCLTKTIGAFHDKFGEYPNQNSKGINEEMIGLWRQSMIAQKNP